MSDWMREPVLRLATHKTEGGLVDGALERMSDWMREPVLRLATHKTEGVLLTGKRRPGSIDGTHCFSNRSLSYRSMVGVIVFKKPIVMK
jgi:hypothetical protein